MIYQIYFYYKKYFPMEIRDHLSQWMITQPISVNSDAARDEQYAKSFLTNLIQVIQLQGIESMEIDNATEMTFIDAAEKISLEILDKDPVSFYFRLYGCVNFGQSLTSNDYEGYKYVFKQIDYIKSLEKHYVNSICTMIQNNFNDTVENRKLVQDIEVITNLLNDVFCLIIQNFLNPWKEKQRYVVKKRNSIELDIIQGWYENITQMCWNTYNNSIICIDLRGANQQDIQNPFIALHVNAKMLLTNLITHAFIIEKQPPQVLHTNTKFQSSVRLLFGNVLPFKPEVEENKVEVLFVNKQQAQEIQRTNTVSTSSCGIFEDNTKLMDYNSINKTMNAAFEDMILKKRPANHRSANDSVMNRKYALCFKLRISFNEGEFVVSLWTISIPIVVILNGNQKLRAWATIYWDNSISRYNNGLVDQVNVPWDHLSNVPWDHLSNVLNKKFSSSIGFDCNILTEDNIAFLKLKVLNGKMDNMSIKWNQFSNDKILPNKKFSFFEWFYKAMKLSRDHLRVLWGDRHIIGFIDKTIAENYLLNCDQGTFLIRFSDSVPGAISIAWKSSSTTVSHILPMNATDLAIRSLTDCIMDCKELTKFYPNVDKLEAIKNYISPPRVVPVGRNYVPRKIRAEI